MQILSTLRSVIRLRRPELDAARLRVASAASVEELRRMARCRPSRCVLDYIDGAAEGEVTAARNMSAFSCLELTPRVLRDMREIDVSGTLIEALAHGASGFMSGRPYFDGLGADGEAGMQYAPNILQEEMRRTVPLNRMASVADPGLDPVSWIKR